MTVGPEFYNQVTSPIMLLLVLLMGVCITLQWRRTSTGRLWHRLRYPLIISIVFPIILYFIGFSDPLSLIGFSATAFAFSLHIQEYLSDCRSLSKTTGRRFAKTLYSIILKNRRRYGGYIIHVSMVLIFFGIIGSALYDSTVPVSLKENVPLQVGDYQFIFKGGIEQEEPERSILTIKLDVGDGLGSSRRLTPRIMNDFRFQSTVVQVDILSLPFEDIYVIPEGIVGDVAKLRIRFVPLINFIWLGGVVMAIGAVICLLPRAKKEVQ